MANRRYIRCPTCGKLSLFRNFVGKMGAAGVPHEVEAAEQLLEGRAMITWRRGLPLTFAEQSELRQALQRALENLPPG